MSENLHWTIGQVRITRLVEMASTRPAGGPESTLPDAWPAEVRQIPWLVPDFADAQGHLHLSVHALLVETPTRRIVVDTCTGNGKRRSMARFDRLATDFLARLEAAGFGRTAVDGVVCTHLHIDHVGWNTLYENGRWVPTFPQARYYFGRQEWQHWEAESRAAPGEGACLPGQAAMLDPQAVYADSIGPVLAAGLVELVDTDARISPEIRLLPTPGHTPGHVSVLVESQGQSAVITGDMLHHPCQIARPAWGSAFDSDAARAQQTRLDFFARFAESGTLVIGTHFGGPTAGLLTRGDGGYRLVGCRG
ncbi:MBL fold metallo-hydrolase [Pseudorhodoferax sp.]|uniref:MBL fold metallo-hydrolase n=1 Tax=Pseudorhodoferax sp. TaxID=1993553 RepID=UPI002DD67AA5|nr:MBL fold metallo-hydrolase [Pseudorhodoferax sp.]